MGVWWRWHFYRYLPLVLKKLCHVCSQLVHFSFLCLRRLRNALPRFIIIFIKVAVIILVREIMNLLKLLEGLSLLLHVGVQLYWVLWSSLVETLSLLIGARYSVSSISRWGINIRSIYLWVFLDNYEGRFFQCSHSAFPPFNFDGITELVLLD